MTKSIAIKSAFSCGGKAWDYLEHISCKNVVLIRDSQMSQGVSNIVSKIRTYMDSMGVIMGEYMIIQFLRGIPRELDESAYIDGCGTFKTLTRIILPLMKPALFSAGLFQFLWTYNDYFNSLIFINSVKKYPISLALRMSLDAESVVQWGKVLAMATVAVIPVMILFFAAQKYFVEGIATSGLKG